MMCVKESDPQAAVHWSLSRGMASPHAPDLRVASTVTRPWGGRCELETQERTNKLRGSAQPGVLSASHSPAAVGVAK